VSDREKLKRGLSSLEVKRGCACSDETTACEQFLRTHDPMIQDVVKKYASHHAGFDDLIQEVRGYWFGTYRTFMLIRLAVASIAGWLRSRTMRRAGRRAGWDIHQED